MPFVPFRSGRLAVSVGVAVLVMVSATAAEGSLPRYKREVKKIRKALVAIELDHDDVVAELEEVREQLKAWGAEVLASEQDLDAMTGDESFFELAAASFRLNHARAQHDEGRARLVDLKQAETGLLSERHAKIAELQGVIRKRLRAEASSPALTLRGSLVTYSADWEAVALCESSGRWGINSRFDGGLQFHPLTWLGFGGGEFARYAYQASKIQQIAIAERVLAIQGPRAWPNCFKPLPFGF